MPIAPPKLGCIADDFTGATDLANNLVRGGMRVTQTIGVPNQPLDVAVDAVVVSLKIRTIAAADAVAQALAALAWLQTQGVQRFYFKICSTFDSTARGNIGPVTEALMDALGCDFSLVTPAFPDGQRTVFKGYLFVGDVLLNESGMRQHPLTPMTDANLVRVLQAQTRRRVGLIDHAVVARGSAAIAERVAVLRSQGVGMAIIDAISNNDLMLIGAALREHLLVTAGSGVAIGLPANWGITPSPAAAALPPAGGRRAVLSGSCSIATNAQVRRALADGVPGFVIDPMAIARGAPVVEQAIAWARAAFESAPLQDVPARVPPFDGHPAASGVPPSVPPAVPSAVPSPVLASAASLLSPPIPSAVPSSVLSPVLSSVPSPVPPPVPSRVLSPAPSLVPLLIYATAEPDAVQRVQEVLGVARAGELVEHALAEIARALVQMGVRQLLVAGGETAGAVVQALGVTRLQIGAQIDPGVPWCAARSPLTGSEAIHLVLKSGNFGSADLFTKAFAQLP